jgi:hypothetical protein
MKKQIVIILLVFTGFIQTNAQNFLTPTGNAGIGSGTTEPTEAKLLVMSSQSNPQLLLVQNNQNDYSRIRFSNLRNFSNRFWDIAGFVGGASLLNDKLEFWNNKTGAILTLTGDGNVGILNRSPKTALSFPAILGKKITLYPGNTGDVGFGVAGNRLQIYSDNPNADVAIGYDAAGTFNERFAVKPNGALAVKANTGNPGQVLTSGGASASAEWRNPINILYQNSASTILTSSFTVNGNGIKTDPFFSRSIFLNGRSKVLINFQVLWNGKGTGCPVFCPPPAGFFDILFDGMPISRTAFSALAETPTTTIGSILFSPTALTGSHTIDIRVTSTSAHDILIVGGIQGSVNFGASNLTAMVIQE